jgi:hypothetical protein
MDDDGKKWWVATTWVSKEIWDAGGKALDISLRHAAPWDADLETVSIDSYVIQDERPDEVFVVVRGRAAMVTHK